MGYIAFIVILVTVINLISSAVKKSAPKQGGQGQAQPAPRQPVRPVPQPPFRQMQSYVQPRTYVNPQTPDQQPAQAVPDQPQRRPAGTHSAGRPSSVPEGVSTMQPRVAHRLESELQPTQLSGQAAPQQAKQPGAYAPAASRQNGLQASAARELRRAMVLKEVLDRPISMRKGQRI